MTWSYNTALTAPKDQVRFLTGDVFVDDQQLSDEEIAFLLLPTQQGSVTRAAMQACRNIAARYARQMNKQVGSLRIDAAERQKHYLDLAASIEMQYVTLAVTPYAGGISVSDKIGTETNSDRVPPYFTRTVDAIPGAVPGGGTDGGDSGMLDEDD